MNSVKKSYDIVVLGAGPGGLAASLAAARNGAKVLLVDKNGYLGGNMTLGLPLLGFVPEDHNIVLSAVFGQTLAEYNKKSPAVASFRRIAKRIQGLPAPIAVR